MKNDKDTYNNKYQLSKIKIGVVLSSGGTRGVYAHTGFLAALDQLGAKISASAGCSAGAFVGSIIASGTPLEQWIESLKEIRTRDFWRSETTLKILWRSIIQKGSGFTGLSDTRFLKALCEQNLACKNFEECIYPFYAIALNIGTLEKTVFSQGELATRVVASSAMPVLYQPVEIDGSLYCDGALVDIAPMDALCCRHDLDLIIVHHCSRRVRKLDQFKARLQKPWPLIEIMDRLLYRQNPWYLSDSPLSENVCPGSCNAKLVVIEPVLDDLPWPKVGGGQLVYESSMQQSLYLISEYFKKNKIPIK